ncbi:hypothetical protein AO260_24945 [Pseudomonas sp. ABAC21]|nr:hypothetical protein AO260_24945 [Pseudomonas sp. ABAC21]
MRFFLIGCLAALTVQTALADNGRLIATGGASSLEGAAGGGITPWAVLAGYGEQHEWGATAFATTVNLPDYRLDVAGLALAGQDVLGMKVRLFGDVIYDRLPQVSLGLEYKHQSNFEIPRLVGARRDSDVEGYLAASRLFMGAAFGYNVLVNGNLRYSRANETGLLGFGGDRRDRRSLLKEGSVAVLFNPRWAVGVEYREKPDNLSFAGESDWADVFVGYFPNKHVSVVLAYARLGEIATLADQNGTYLSVQGSF